MTETMISEIGIRFPSSNKIYKYIWPDTLKYPTQGSEIAIRDYTGKKVVVKIKSFRKNVPYGSSLATNTLNVVLSEYFPDTNNCEAEASKDHFQSGDKTEEGNLIMDKKFIGTGLDSLTKTKDTVIALKVGKTVLETIKTTLKNVDFLPDQIKLLLDVPGYSDMVIGFALEVAAEMFLDNEKLQYAAKAARLAGTVEMASEVTFIEETITAVLDTALKGAKISVFEDDTKKTEASVEDSFKE